MLLSSIVLTPPRSTSRSKPTRSSTLFTMVATAFAMIQPTRRMTRKPTSLGTNVATELHASDSPCWKSIAKLEVFTALPFAIRSAPGQFAEAIPTAGCTRLMLG
ncbi:Uncharacterised protein [Mycobacteroides abscessus subsp. abscessus]|nr:Uncharacterised protein [Mycobacteroides abscessus subsp. abscessus]